MVCGETTQHVRLVDRALDDGRIDDALEWAREASNQRVTALCWTFHDRDQLDALVDANLLPDPDYEPIPIDEVYDTALMLLECERTDEALAWIRLAVRERILDEALYGLREAAEEADVWNRDVREALLDEVYDNWPDAAPAHHLRFSDLSTAFDLWVSTNLQRSEWRRFGQQLLDEAVDAGSTGIGLSVALALADSRIEQAWACQLPEGRRAPLHGPRAGRRLRPSARLADRPR